MDDSCSDSVSLGDSTPEKSSEKSQSCPENNYKTCKGTVATGSQVVDLQTHSPSETSNQSGSSTSPSVTHPKKRSLEETCPLALKIFRREYVRTQNQIGNDELVLQSNSVSKQNRDTLHKSEDCVKVVKSFNTPSHNTDVRCILNISDIPLPLLLQSFSYLPLHDLLHGVSLVNKSWHNLAHDPSLWRTIYLRRYSKVNDSVLLKLTSLSENVQYLDISDLRLLTSDGVTATLRNCPQLQTLKMLRCMHLPSPVFHGVGEHCSSIQHLYLDGCYALCNGDLMKIASGCPKLELLRINQCNKITSRGIKAIAENCPHLKEITMDQCTKISDAAIESLVDHCPNLQAISCMSCDLTDDGVSLLAKAKELRFLEVSNIKRVRNKSIMEVVQNCPKLESIYVSLCNSINDACVEFIAKNAKLLKKAYLVSCDLTDQALISFGAYSKTLETVDVGWCRAITDSGVRAISATCPTLRYLGLMRCDQVTISGTEELVVRYPHITYSTRWLETRRLLERARREGVCSLPYLSYPTGSGALH